MYQSTGDLTPSDRLLVNADKAAELLDISRSTFYRRVAEGQIRPPIRIGPRVARWVVKDLIEDVEQMKQCKHSNDT